MERDVVLHPHFAHVSGKSQHVYQARTIVQQSAGAFEIDALVEGGVPLAVSHSKARSLSGCITVAIFLIVYLKKSRLIACIQSSYVA